MENPVAAILIATVVLALIGLIIGIALVSAGKKFAVETDPREAQVRENLPGNNCGACGFAGCDAVAAAIVSGEAPVNACPICSQQGRDQIGAIMGADAGTAVEMEAFVRCAGDCHHTHNKCNYVGIDDCRAAVLSGISVWECDFGCIGFGTCAKACPFGAITVMDGVAVVDTDICVGCGKCVAVCPKNLITLTPKSKTVAVRCSNPSKGPEVKKVCTAGCLGCTLCTKKCETGAITMNGNLAVVDYDKCVGCGKCADACPRGIICRFDDLLKKK